MDLWDRNIKILSSNYSPIIKTKFNQMLQKLMYTMVHVLFIRFVDMR